MQLYRIMVLFALPGLLVACPGAQTGPDPVTGPPPADSGTGGAPAANPGETADTGDTASPAAGTAPAIEEVTAAQNPPNLPRETLPMGQHTLLVLIDRGRAVEVPASTFHLRLTVGQNAAYILEEVEHDKVQKRAEGKHQVQDGVVVFDGPDAPPYAMAVAYYRGKLLLCRSALSERGDGTGVVPGEHQVAPLTHAGRLVDPKKVPPATFTFDRDGTMKLPKPPPGGSPRYRLKDGLLTVLDGQKVVEHNAVGFFGQRLVLCREALRALDPPAVAAGNAPVGP